jgi:hypothetical protein
MQTRTNTFILGSSVYACIASDTWVFLDLANDNYCCLDKDTSSRLKPSAINPAEINVLGLEANAPCFEAVNDLRRRRLIVSGPAGPHSNRLGAISQPEESMTQERVKSDTTWRSIGRFYKSTLQAHFSLKYQSLERTVHRCVKRRNGVFSVDRRFNFDEASRIYSQFSELRPFFPRNYLCIFDSLALLNFFATFDLFPSWVFGVKLGPFHAHCWLQQGSVVLNDSISYVRQFTPIMAV